MYTHFLQKNNMIYFIFNKNFDIWAQITITCWCDIRLLQHHMSNVQLPRQDIIFHKFTLYESCLPVGRYEGNRHLRSKEVNKNISSLLIKTSHISNQIEPVAKKRRRKKKAVTIAKKKAVTVAKQKVVTVAKQKSQSPSQNKKASSRRKKKSSHHRKKKGSHHRK